MAKTPDLKSAYALETPDDSRALYADWAETYDSGFIDETGYILHRQVAEAFAAAGGTGPVLDLGAGTGGVGAVLKALGIGPLIATDISPEMLRVAEEKRLYAEVFVGDILSGLPRDDASFQGIVSAGTFTLGHVGPEGLDEVARLLAPGGLAVISVRDTHFEAAGFAHKLAHLEPILSRVSRKTVRIYAEDSTAEHKDDLSELLYLWKA